MKNQCSIFFVLTEVFVYLTPREAAAAAASICLAMVFSSHYYLEDKAAVISTDREDPFHAVDVVSMEPQEPPQPPVHLKHRVSIRTNSSSISSVRISGAQALNIQTGS